jgi:hypothetical protein
VNLLRAGFRLLDGRLNRHLLAEEKRRAVRTTARARRLPTRWWLPAGSL